MGTVHIIGSGISGLSAATALAEKRIPVKLYEASAHAGGRCRSSRDAVFGTIDHGLHLVDARDRELGKYLVRIQSAASLQRVDALAYPAAPLLDYAPILRGLCLPRAAADASLSYGNVLRDAWLKPLARVFFASPPEQLPMRSLRQLFRRHAPRMLSQPLQEGLVQPALDYLDQYGGSVYFSHALIRLERTGQALKALSFARKKIELMPDDLVILATPPAFTQTLLPELAMPQQSHPAITVHFECEHRETESVAYPVDAPIDILRYRPGQISASIRLADPCWHSDPALVAQRLWRAIQKRHSYLRDMAMPRYAIWREKRAGHAVADIPPVPHDHGQLLLAGDWITPSRPATLEQAAASGHRAAALAMERLPKTPPRQQPFYLN